MTEICEKLTPDPFAPVEVMAAKWFVGKGMRWPEGRHVVPARDASGMSLSLTEPSSNTPSARPACTPFRLSATAARNADGGAAGGSAANPRNLCRPLTLSTPAFFSSSRRATSASGVNSRSPMPHVKPCACR